MIWKAPWKKHINLKAVLEVSNPMGEVGYGFTITFQSNGYDPVFVFVGKSPSEMFVENKYIRDEQVIEINQWHDDLIAAWTNIN